jgi:hypothetical protein
LLILSVWRTRNAFVAIMADLHEMPPAMRRLAVVQFFSWFALFAMWIYTTAAVTQVHYGATDPQSGYIRARRFEAVTCEPSDQPKYTTVHECQSPDVADSPEWEAVRQAQTPVWNGQVSAQVTFAPGSPGVYRRVFPN